MTRLLYCSLKRVWEASGEYYSTGSWPEYIPSLASYFDEIYLMVPVLKATPDKLIGLSKFKDSAKLKFVAVRDIPLINTPFGAIFPLWSLANLNIFRDLHKKAEVTLIAIPPSIPHLAYLPMKNKPLITLIAGDEEEIIRTSPKSRLRSRLWGIAYPKITTQAEKYIFKKSDAVICRNQKFKQKLVNKYHLGEDKIHVITSGVNSNIFMPFASNQKAEMKSGLKLDNSLVIGFVASRISVAKGGDTIIKVFQEMRKDMPNVKLLLIGEDKIGIPEDKSIINIGFIRKEELPGYYNIMDVFMFPSRSEGAPKVIMEACACGIPVISTNVGGMPELIQEKENGFIFDPEDVHSMMNCCRLLLEDEQMRIQTGKKARQYALKNFDSADLVRKTAEAIKSVL